MPAPSPHPPAEGAGRDLPILERAAETDALEGLLARAQASAGGVVVIEAGAGMGKTTLVRHLVERAEASGARVLRATGSELETGFPFGIVGQLLERPLQEAIAQRSPQGVTGAARLASRVLGSEVTDAAPETQAPAAVHALYRVTIALAAEQALLLAVDDAHWADVASLRYLHYLSRRVGDCPVAVVIATRPVELASAPPPLAALLGSDEVATLHPGLLSEAGVAELARRALGSDPPAALVESCVRATGGNAFLLTALLRELSRGGAGGMSEVPTAFENLAPDAVRYRVGGWLHGLPAPAIAVARSLAVLGEAKLPLLASQSELPIDATRDACARLERLGVIESSDVVRFTHPLVANVVRRTIPAGELSAAHRRAAELLGEVDMPLDARAVHLLATRPEADPWTAELLHEAATRALARGAPAEAAGYLQRALEEPPAPEQRAALLLELGVAWVRLGEHGKAQQALERGYESAPAGLRSHIAIVVSQAHYLAGDNEAALHALEQARSVEADQARILALDGNAISLGLLDRENGVLMRTRLSEYAERARTGDLHEPILLTLAGAYSVLQAQPRDEGVALIRRAFDAGLSAFGDYTYAFGWAVSALEAADLADEAILHVDRALDEARPRGDASVTSYILFYRVHVAYRLGRLAEAEADGRSAQQLSGLGEEGTFPVSLIDVLVERDKADEAAELCQQLWEHEEPGGSEQRVAMVDLVRARVDLAFGRPEKALPRLLGAGERLDDLLFLHPQFAPWRALAAPAADAVGQRTLALRLADEGLELARRCETPTALAQALRVEGHLRGDLATLKASVEEVQDTPDLLEYGRSLTALGSAQVRAGDHAAARETLRAALAAAHEAGALRLAKAARQELVAAGGRPRRAALRGVEALTPGELQVARLARDGLSNREISDSLFVSLKMVEQHLARAYAKLEIGGRQELSGALRS